MKISNAYLMMLVSVLAAAVLILMSLFKGKMNSVTLVSSPYQYQKTIQNLKKAIIANNFKIVREFSTESSHTLYFCNFNIAHNLIKKNKKAGVILPCKIKVLKNDNQVYIATIDLKSVQRLVRLNIGGLCKKIDGSIKQIVSETVI